MSVKLRDFSSMTDTVQNVITLNITQLNPWLDPVVKLWGNAGNGVPLPFLAGECRFPGLHDDSYLQHKQQK